MSSVHITETILRDAHQSLIATRMRTEDMLPACRELDQIGFWSLEVWGGATFDSCLRFLKEDPWERLRLLRQALPNTRLQMLLRGQNLLGYRHYADDVVRAFVQKSATNGIDVFRIFDALNDLRNIRVAVETVRECGKHAQGAICYTISPVHSIQGFVAQARELAAMGCDSIVIKDMAGLLTPMVAAELFRALRAAVDLPLQLHSHATAGLADMCHLKAIENGCGHIDTAISAFAGGTSHTPTESMIAALRGTPYDTGLDLEAVQRLGFYFLTTRKKYHQYESDYTGVDTRVQVNQVPGGMISNLANQLREQNSLDQMNRVLDEIPRVREDLGFPPLVTPTSQIVGTQAVLNVLTPQRYQTITNEVKQYLRGGYGQPPAPVNPELQQQATGSTELIDCRPADLLPPELDSLRQAAGSLAHTEEDVLICAMFPEIGRQFLEQRAAGTLTPEILQPHPSSMPAVSPHQAGAPTEFQLMVHGETFRIKINGVGQETASNERHFYLVVDGIPEEVYVKGVDAVGGESAEDSSGGRRVPTRGGRPAVTRDGQVSAAMPCKIIDVLVNINDFVTAGKPVLVTEAMKMETEVVATVSGKVTGVYVKKGDNVVPEEALIEIDASQQPA
jgi:pyruvate carboxylase subunit B